MKRYRFTVETIVGILEGTVSAGKIAERPAASCGAWFRGREP